MKSFSIYIFSEHVAEMSNGPISESVISGKTSIENPFISFRLGLFFPILIDTSYTSGR